MPLLTTADAELGAALALNELCVGDSYERLDRKRAVRRRAPLQKPGWDRIISSRVIHRLRSQCGVLHGTGIAYTCKTAEPDVIACGSW